MAQQWPCIWEDKFKYEQNILLGMDGVWTWTEIFRYIYVTKQVFSYHNLIDEQKSDESDTIPLGLA
jgi:hypothetical protein